MNSEDLLLFDRIAQAGSLSAVALSIGCDVSTLSRRIHQLERTAGCRLFHRSGRGVELTEQGRTLQRYAVQLRTLLDQAQGSLQQLHNVGPSHLHIAAQPTIAKVLFGDLFHALQSEFVGTHIRFSEGLASGILENLSQGTVDAAILYKPSSPNAQHYVPLATERLCLITPPSFHTDRTQWHFENLETIPLILPSTQHGLRVLINQMASRSGFTPHVVLESDSSIDLTLELVRKGCGCTVLPLAAALKDVSQGQLQAFLLQDTDTIRSIAFATGKTPLSSQDTWRLRQLVSEQIQHLISSNRWPGAQVA